MACLVRTRRKRKEEALLLSFIKNKNISYRSFSSLKTKQEDCLEEEEENGDTAVMESETFLQERNNIHDVVEYNHSPFLASGLSLFSLFPQQQTLTWPLQFRHALSLSLKILIYRWNNNGYMFELNKKLSARRILSLCSILLVLWFVAQINRVVCLYRFSVGC